jgi:hypothetical protein
MKKYIVHSTVTISTIVELDDDDQTDVFECAGDYAGDEIYKILKDVDFEFHGDWQVFDTEGNEIEETTE